MRRRRTQFAARREPESRSTTRETSADVFACSSDERRKPALGPGQANTRKRAPVRAAHEHEVARASRCARDELEHDLDAHAPADEHRVFDAECVEHAFEVVRVCRYVHAIERRLRAGAVEAAIVPGDDAEALPEVLDLVPKRRDRPAETVGEHQHRPVGFGLVVSKRRRTASRRKAKLLHEENSTGPGTGSPSHACGRAPREGSVPPLSRPLV